MVAILGMRQVGKTTLARALAGRTLPPGNHFDLEDPRAVARLADPMLALEPLRGLVVLDEIQLRPDLFPVLRVLADRPRRPARFLVLGSAAPALLRRKVAPTFSISSGRQSARTLLSGSAALRSRTRGSRDPAMGRRARSARSTRRVG